MSSLPMSTLLEVRDLSVHIGAARPVDGVSLNIAAGECLALLGESGCGKSMTALALMRLLPAAARVASGSVRFVGEEILALPESSMRRLRGGGIGMIFQEPGTSLNPVLTIGRQIGEALALHQGLTGSAADRAAVELLDQVGIPDAARRLTEYPFQLSGGMKQRVMIAIALAGNPRLLIADEPTTALDVTIQAQVLDLLDRLRRERGMGLLLITHDLGVVAHMADRVGVMYAGQLIEEAGRESFFRHPAHPYSQRLFAALPDARQRGGRLASIPGSVPAADVRHAGCRFVERCDVALPICGTSLPAWRTFDTAQRMRCHLSGQPADVVAVKVGAGETVIVSQDAQEAPLLAVADLCVHFPVKRGILQRTVGQVRAVDGISFSLHAGRSLALVGESGCGKTTAGKALLHLIEPTTGTVRLHGSEVRGIRADQMQMVFQDPFASLDPRLSVGEIIAEGMRALHLPGEHASQIAQLLEKVGLRADMVDRYPHEFSGGQRQRIAIARALAVKPRLLICDEPTSALDVSVQAQILNLLIDLQRELGLAYVFITHNIGVVDYLADDVAVMYLGRIVEQGPAAEVLRSPRHPYTQALLAAVPEITDAPHATRATSVGDMPSPMNPPSGCHFHPRCRIADSGCASRYPEPRRLGASLVSCYKAD
jgi:peptide/nickel transport system ATP-binding protein